VRSIAVAYIGFAYVFEFNFPLFCRRTRGRNRVSLIDISIVMATYRRPTSIVEAIKSILDQRDVRVEVFVIDDCPDGSAESVVLGIGDPRVHYIRNPNPSKGRPAIPRNVGWPLTKGEILHFADDDDLVPEGLYADALAEFHRFANIGLVFGSIEAFGEPSQRLVDEQALFARAAKRASRLQKLHSARIFAANLLFRDLLFVGGSTLIRRRCVEALGGLPTRAVIMEDVDFLARATRMFGVRYLNRPSLHYRVWPSIMHSQTDLQGALNRGYQQLQAGYRETFGTLDFYILKIAARTLLRFV
jgi:glycosyltransferase involved in cell wall biosynthesis